MTSRTDDGLGNGEEVEIVRSNLADAHWSPFQMAAYQSSSGCGINTGDLLGTGTLSSPVSQQPLAIYFGRNLG